MGTHAKEVVMKRKHKPRPEPPKWYFYDEDDCWACKNRNACNSCKRLKKFRRKYRDRKDKNFYE